MLRFMFRRVVWLIPVLICVSFIVFALMDLAPGTIVDSMINDEMSQEDIDNLRKEYDLDKPMVYRYGKYMLGLVQGNLGNSEISGLSVWETYIGRFPATLKLSLMSVILAICIAIPLGILAAKHAGTILDNLTTAFALIGLSMPSFWLALLLVLWFSYDIKLFPAVYDGSWKCYVLPVVATGLSMAGTVTRQTRSAILEVTRQDYLRTARAKGVSERQVTVKHELRNAWIPIITQIGMMLGITIAGSAVTETVFSWPGVGRMLVEAITSRDTTSACGCVVLTSCLFVLMLLIVDIVYAFVDPRIKAQYASTRKKRRVSA